MKVLMRTTAAGPEFVLDAGKVYDLPDAVATEFLAGQFAEPAAAGAKATPRTRPDPSGAEAEVPAAKSKR